MPTVNKVHYDKYLTNISIGYENEAFIADQIFLPVDVNKQSDKYYVFGYEQFKQHDDRRSPGTESNEINWTFSDDSYYCEGHALSTFIPDEEYENADEYIVDELEANSTELITEGIRLNKEIDAADKLTDPNLIDAGLSHAVTNKWNDYTSDSNPQLEIEEGKKKLHQKSGLRPNTLVVSEPVYQALKFHPKLITILGVNALQMLTHEMLETILGVRILVGRALKDSNPTSKITPTPALNYVWGANAVLCYIAPRAVGRKTRTAALSFQWTRRDRGAVGVRRWYEEAKQATKIEAEHWYDQKIISGNSSYIFVDAVA